MWDPVWMCIRCFWCITFFIVVFLGIIIGIAKMAHSMQSSWLYLGCLLDNSVSTLNQGKYTLLVQNQTLPRFYSLFGINLALMSLIWLHIGRFVHILPLLWLHMDKLVQSWHISDHYPIISWFKVDTRLSNKQPR